MGGADQTASWAGDELAGTAPRGPGATILGSRVVRLGLGEPSFRRIQVVCRGIEWLNRRTADGAGGDAVDAPTRDDGGAVSTTNAVSARKKGASGRGALANNTEGMVRVRGRSPPRK